jgi:hypothetical protein
MDEEYLTMYPNSMPQQEAAMTYLFTYAPPILRVCVTPSVADDRGNCSVYMPADEAA